MKLFIFGIIFFSQTVFAGDFQASVFGQDNRRVINSAAAPWGWVGRLMKDDKPNCTAFVIGPRLVMTASHCLEIVDGVLKGTYKFSADLAGDRIDGRNFRSYETDQYISSGRAAVPGHWYYNEDFAILRLKESLPEGLGQFELAKELPDLTTSFMSVGYPQWLGGLQHKVVDEACTIHQATGFQLFHDCGITRGNSGGPIFYKSGSQYFVVGVVSTQYPTKIEGVDYSVYGEEFSIEKANVASSIPEGFAWIARSIEDLSSRP